MAEWEPIPGAEGTYQRFLCDVPPEGVKFQVLSQEWEFDAAGIGWRTIHAVRLAGAQRDGRDDAVDRT